MERGRRGRRREHPQPTFCTTTKKNARGKLRHFRQPYSGGNAPLGGYCTTSGWACTHPSMDLYYYSSSNTKCTSCACAYDHFRSLTSLPVKRSHQGIVKLPVAHAHNILPVPDMTSSDHVTSGHVTSDCSFLFPHKYDFVRTHILLMYLHLDNWEFCRVISENMTLFMLSLKYFKEMYCFYVLLWTKNVY